MRKGWIATTLMALLMLATGARAQDGIWAKWGRQTDEALRSQPNWTTPLGTSSAVLSQRYRSDFTRQITPSRTTTWNYGSSKGLNVIPWHRLEINFLPPPYIQHNSPAANDGFGDFALLAKFRITSGNAQHGDYAIGASLGGTFPTGSFKNGSPRGTISPTIYAGKGFGDFDVQSSVGANLPTGDSATLGRSVA